MIYDDILQCTKSNKTGLEYAFCLTVHNCSQEEIENRMLFVTK